MSGLFESLRNAACSGGIYGFGVTARFHSEPSVKAVT
jgi:hypothetical protein